MAATDHNPQHNDSVDREQKQADQGETKRNSASSGPHNPHQGQGHDERGRYARTAADPDSPERYGRSEGGKT